MNDYCTDYFNCFINSINMGLRLGGGLGDNLVVISAI